MGSEASELLLDFFVMYLLLRYKAIGLLRNFGERCKIRDLRQINIFESVT